MSNANPFRCFQWTFLRDVFLMALAVLGLAYFGRRYGIGVMVRSRKYR